MLPMHLLITFVGLSLTPAKQSLHTIPVQSSLQTATVNLPSFVGPSFPDSYVVKRPLMTITCCRNPGHVARFVSVFTHFGKVSIGDAEDCVANITQAAGGIIT